MSVDTARSKLASKSATRVLIADKLAERVNRWFQARPASFSVRSDPSLKGDALSRVMAAFDPHILVVRSTKIEECHLSLSTSLSVIIRAGSGVNTIDVAAASRRGVFVANCPGRNAVAVAELALGHLIACDRRISAGTRLFYEKQWKKKEMGKGNRGLRGRRLALLGLGQIGSIVARYCRALGMQVVAYSRSLNPRICEELGIDYAESAADACQDADALSVHLPLNDSTEGMIGRDLLSLLKPGAIVVNTSRGGVIDEAALAELAKERGFRLGLDVICHEPSGSDTLLSERTSALLECGCVESMTPHIGASTAQAEEAVGDEVLRIVQSFVECGSVPNCVNLEIHAPVQCTLTVRHADRVGVLAGILSELRKEGINVENMHNVVFQGGYAACAKLELSKVPSDECLTHLDECEHVMSVNVAASRK